MELKFGDIQETALIPLTIKASETARPNARIRDLKAKEIIDTLGVDVSKYDPFMSHEGVVARTVMFRDALTKLLKQYPDAPWDGYDESDDTEQKARSVRLAKQKWMK